MPAATLAAFVLAPVLLFAPADAGIPLVIAIYDRSDFAFSSAESCPHGSSDDNLTGEMYVVDVTAPGDARIQAFGATSDDDFWQDMPRDETDDGFYRGRPRPRTEADLSLM